MVIRDVPIGNDKPDGGNSQCEGCLVDDSELRDTNLLPPYLSLSCFAQEIIVIVLWFRAWASHNSLLLMPDAGYSQE